MKRKLIILILLLCVTIIACFVMYVKLQIPDPIMPTDPPATQPPALTISAGAHCLNFSDESLRTTMNYWLYVPEHATENMPLIVFLHGAGQIANINSLKDYALINNIYDIYGNEFPFLIMLPNTTIKSWSEESVTMTLKALIDNVVDQYCVDSDHIILTGHSLGAIGTWQMLSVYGDFFSAAVPVSNGSGRKLSYENIAKVPIKAYVGGYESDCAGAMKKIVNEILESGGTTELITLEECNHNDTATMPYTLDLLEWMLMQ